MSADTAPAEMPGEAIRRIIEDALCEPATVEFAVSSLEALFAPILAEKERAVKEAMRECAKWATEAGEAKGRLEASELAGVVEGWRDRALAAEAALAAERERVEQLHATIRKAHVAMTMACALPGVAAEYDFSEAIASTEATLARRAAVIRAEGE